MALGQARSAHRLRGGLRFLGHARSQHGVQPRGILGAELRRGAALVRVRVRVRVRGRGRGRVRVRVRVSPNPNPNPNRNPNRNPKPNQVVTEREEISLPISAANLGDEAHR